LSSIYDVNIGYNFVHSAPCRGRR